MQVHDGWLILLCVQMSDTPARERVGEEAEVAPARNGNVTIEQPYRGERKLDQSTAARRIEDVTKARKGRYAVEIMADGKDARVVYKAFFP
jgi:hypothetical protein